MCGQWGEERCAEPKTIKIAYYPPLFIHEYDGLGMHITLFHLVERFVNSYEVMAAYVGLAF